MASLRWIIDSVAVNFLFSFNDKACLGSIEQMTHDYVRIRSLLESNQTY